VAAKVIGALPRAQRSVAAGGPGDYGAAVAAVRTGA